MKVQELEKQLKNLTARLEAGEQRRAEMDKEVANACYLAEVGGAKEKALKELRKEQKELKLSLADIQAAILVCSEKLSIARQEAATKEREEKLTNIEKWLLRAPKTTSKPKMPGTATNGPGADTGK